MTGGLRFLAGLVVLVLVVIGVSYVSRLADRTTDVENCTAISVPGSYDAAARDWDLIDFARSAADARRKDGQTDTADHYDGIADRADDRRQRTLERARTPCSERFPRPALLP